jgi:hypothetical protein
LADAAGNEGGILKRECKMKNTKLLLTSTFKHQKDISIFLTGENFKHNRYYILRIYRHLRNIIDDLPPDTHGEFWNCLNFFNLLYDQVNIIVRYRRKPTMVIDHLRNLDLDDYERLFLLRYLSSWLIFVVDDEEVNIPSGSVIRDHCIEVCEELIREEYESLEMLLFQHPPLYGFPFEPAQAFLALMTNLDDKINYLIGTIKGAKQAMASKADQEFQNDGEVFIRRCEIEIESIKRLKAEGYYGSVAIENESSNHRRVKEETEEEEEVVVGPDTRIRCNASKEQIEAYFHFELGSKNKKGVLIMEKEDIDYFMAANFSAFPNRKPPKLFTPNTNQAHIKRIVYGFYFKYKNSTREAVNYCQALIDNFSQFSKYQGKIHDLKKNWSI